jgi:hypothetical protein
MNSCFCCDQPSGFGPTIECKTKSGHASNCGEQWNGYSGKFYKHVERYGAFEKVDYSLDGVTCVRTAIPQDYTNGADLLSNEDTPEAAKDRAIANMGDWDADWFFGETGGLWELGASVGSTKWRVAHVPTPTCYLKVWVKSAFFDLADATVTETLVGTYEWFGKGNPCIPKPFSPLSNYYGSSGLDPANLIHSDSEVVEPVPETLGYSNIRIQKYSFVRGYEPDISDPTNPQPNGFPDPTWEPAAP